jgi:hypothetical protein
MLVGKMVGIMYHEHEIVDRKIGAHVTGNGTTWVGKDYIDNPRFRVDVIIIELPTKTQKVTNMNTIDEISTNDRKFRINKDSKVEISKR